MPFETPPTAEAILWWRTLLTDLGRAPETGSPGPLGEQARRRCGDLIELFHDCCLALDVTLLLELGAYTGETSRRFVEVDENKRRALALEASPVVYGKYQHTHEGKPGVKYINRAVGDRDGEVIFNIPKNDFYVVWGSVANRADFTDVEPCKVEMLTIDTILTQNEGWNGLRRTAGWIDVEGLSLDVLRGGGQALAKEFAVLFIEVNDYAVFEGKGSSYEVIEHLLRNDFIPIARDNEYSNAWNLLAIHKECFGALKDMITRWTYKQTDVLKGPV